MPEGKKLSQRPHQQKLRGCKVKNRLKSDDAANAEYLLFCF